MPITIDFLVNEKKRDNPKPIAKLTKWSLEDQSVRGIFPHGRFCLRADDISSLPTILSKSTAGIRFVDFVWHDEIDWSTHQTGQIQLEYVGSYIDFITSLNTIINA